MKGKVNDSGSGGEIRVRASQSGTGSALRTPTARRILRGCQRGNQVLIFLFEADLLLGPWAAPLRPASCRLRWQEHTNESAPDSSSHGTPVAVRISGLQVETNFSPCYIGCESQLTT
jgi:hypothetical protein